MYILQPKIVEITTMPYTSKVRNQIITFITVLDAFTTTYTQPLLNIKASKYLRQFQQPKKSVAPSIISQITETTITVNPYILSLSSNFYYPLSTMDPLDIEEETGTQHSSATTQQLKSHTRVTVEDSMEKIDDLLKEFGDLDNTESQDMAPVTTSPSIPHAIQSNKSSSSIRFSLFPRKVVQAHKANINQLSQLKSFFKCILSTNSQT
jgi:hypothetical protein